MVSDMLLHELLVHVAGLNPCSNGIWSLTQEPCFRSRSQAPCLNPCSNGIWSLTDPLSSDELKADLS